MSYNINLKHLEYFIKTAKLGSINKAAQVLYISQPYLGKILRDLETDLGAPLFHRSKQGVTLTPEGLEFLPRAINIIKQMDGLHFHPPKETDNVEPLSVSMTKFSHVMESFITVIQRHQNQPSFAHRLYEGQTDEVIEDVVSGHADIGIIHFDSKRRRQMEAGMAGRGLTYQFLSYAEPHIVISKNHPLILAQKPITFETLRDYGFIRYLGQYDDMLHSLFGQDYHNGESRITKEIFVTGRATLMNLISLTDFYSIGIHDFDHQLAGFNAVSLPISGCELMFEFGCITMEGVPISEIAKEFLREVRERLARIEERGETRCYSTSSKQL